MQRNVIKERFMSFTKENTSLLSLSFKLLLVHYRENECNLFLRRVLEQSKEKIPTRQPQACRHINSHVIILR